jgi:hypothetical protein
MTTKRCKVHEWADVKLELTPDLKHYGKWVCSECDKYIVWAKNPQTETKLKERQEQILGMVWNDELQNLFFLSKDKLKVLMSLYMVPHLNLVQQQQYDAILSADN